MQHLDPTFASPTATHHTLFGLGGLASLADIAHNGLSAFTVVAPILLSIAALWQAWTAHRRLADEREARRRERIALQPPPVVASPAAVGPVVGASR